jgi:hypothetical protein
MFAYVCARRVGILVAVFKYCFLAPELWLTLSRIESCRSCKIVFYLGQSAFNIAYSRSLLFEQVTQ